jgi:hypothetical protein
MVLGQSTRSGSVPSKLTEPRLLAGKSAAGWNYKRPAAERGSWDAIYNAVRTGWQSAVREALNDFQVARSTAQILTSTILS